MIIYSFVISKLEEVSFRDTLLVTIISPYFLGLIILFLVCYILFYKLKKQKTITKKPSNSEGQYSWKDIENGVINLREQLICDNYIPSLLVGIGRGGAIVRAFP